MASRRLEVHRNPEESSTEVKRPLRDESLRDCRLCKSEHALRLCPKFRRMPVGERWETVKRFQYCFNCLAHTHMVSKCKSRERCMECCAEHHTLLHRHKRQRGTRNPARKSDTQASGSSKAQKKKRNKRGKKAAKKPGANNNQACSCSCQQHNKQQPQRQLQPHMAQNSTPATIIINVMSGHIAS